jgi:hypothetical protein
MKLLNYDAPEELVIKVLEQAIPDFILEVIRKQEAAFYHGDEFYLQMLCPLQCYEQGEVEKRRSTEGSLELFTPISLDQCLRPTPIRKFTQASYRNIVSLLHTIPVYLRKNKRDDDEGGDLLGAYYPDKNNPYIELYMQDIWNAAKANDLHYKWLLTKVLIHELAHAALDVYNLENGEYIEEKVKYSTEFGKWREESMANAITLRIIREFDDSAFYAYAKEFMLHQPDRYALGVLLENFDDLDFDSVLEAKYMGVLPVNFAEEWMAYVQGTPDWEGLHQRNKELIGEWAKNQKNNSKEISNC